MPTFFQAITRLIQGKPVFDANDNQSEVTKDPTQAAPLAPLPVQEAKKTFVKKGDESTFPLVHIRRTLTRFSGENMQVYCFIHNYSAEEIELDKIRLLGTTHELDYFLRPGQEREFLVYSGPKLKAEHDHEASIDYKTRNGGDYFRAIHDVKFHYHSDSKTYSIEALRLNPPIEDIFG